MVSRRKGVERRIRRLTEQRVTYILVQMANPEAFGVVKLDRWR